jgi:hypothetical protein
VELDGRTVSGGYRYGYNGEESVDEVCGEKNGYDYGNRFYNIRIVKFLSLDTYTAQYPSQSPFSFACNTPIMGKDVNGDSLYILTYVSGNKRGDDMFKAAAITRQYDIEHSKGFNPKRDKVVLIEVTDLGKLEAKVEQAVNDNSKTYGPTVEFGIWSHSALQGPIGGDGEEGETSGPDAIAPNQLTLNGWGKIDFNWSKMSKRAGFYGCRSGVVNPETKMSFSRQISKVQNFKDVTVFGQSDYSFPSKFSDYRTPTFNQSLTQDFLPVVFTTAVVYKTYMVASDKSKYSTERATVFGAPASKMNYFKNGKGIGSYYQAGDKN